jgi:excinuclease ABC subunit A
MNFLHIKNASENYLKNVSLDIPHNKLIVVTGISGSGKSSLIYDVIATEGMRLFYDHFLSSGRSAGMKTKKPKVELIDGLRPVVVVNQNSVVRNNRSTVGTLSEIYDFLRLLFARQANSEISDIVQNKSLFSFNTQHGQCSHCKGLGVLDKISPDLIVGDENKSLKEGALILTTPNNYIVYSQVTMDELQKVCLVEGFSVNTAWKDLTIDQQNVIWYGSEKVKVLFGKHTLESRLKWTGMVAKPRDEDFYKGIINIMDEILRRDRNSNILRFANSVKCHHCNGTRLNETALSFYWKNKNIADFIKMTIDELHDFFSDTKELDAAETEIANAIVGKTNVLRDLGLGYLQLDRESPSLSGGESQRIKLVNQVTGNLQNVLYILDEPGSGLHPSEQQKLLKVLRLLVSSGNTVIMTGHDESIIPLVDYIIDIGPGAANQGGEIIYNGSVEEFLKNAPRRSITAKYLNDNRKEFLSESQVKADILIKNLRKNNLKNIDVELCSGALNIVTGVSGAGKSSLISDLIHKLQSGEVVNKFSRINHIDQKPIGRSPKSNPATYTGLSNHIRDLMAALPQAKDLNLTKSHFSFVAKGGRCEECSGAGYIQVGMHFLGNVEVICEKCNGKRFTDTVLEVQYNGKNIYEILELTVDQAHEHFQDEKKILRYTEWLKKLGLGYLKLGQSSTTLSGGEAQRIKLATALVKNSSKNCLYVLDEPATGLHASDTEMLIEALQNLCKNSHTVLCSSHEPRFIVRADYIVDLGPGSGAEGGKLVFNGKLIDILKQKDSLTALALNRFLNNDIVYDINEQNYLNTSSDSIEFEDITTNNLKNINFSVPHNSIAMVCGVSGSGKSSLIFDTVYAECKRRQLDGMSGYIRQFIGKEGKPEFGSAKGLMPAVALKKKSAGHNPRSTIGTYTGLYDLYRLLFSRSSEKDGQKSNLLSNAFSFNHEDGACPICNGLGFISVADPDKFVSDPSKSILDGAMNGSKQGKFYGSPDDRFVAILDTVGKANGIDYSLAWNQLDDNAKEIAMYGCGNEEFEVKWNYKRGNVVGVYEIKSVWIGFVGLITDEYDRKHTDKRGEGMMSIMKSETCANCNSYRVKPEILKYLINDSNIGQLTNLSANKAIDWFENNEFDAVSQRIITQIVQILNALIKSGIGYLPIDRITSTLSGGEFQRLQIAGLLKSSLTGILYVLDEPSFGLGKHDIEKISYIIKDLRNKGNTILMNDHSQEILKLADHISVMGPAAGKYGGEIKNNIDKQGYIRSLNKTPKIEFNYSKKSVPALVLKSANANNLENVDVEFYDSVFNVITGSSGSGKTSLLEYVIYDSLRSGRTVNCEEINLNDNISQIIFTGQDIINSSVMSIPATRLDVFDFIRELFAKTEDAKQLGFKASHFTYHSKFGQCPDCKGTGIQKTSMDYWSDSEVICETCDGKRYNPQVLKIKLDDYSISDVLKLSFKDVESWLENLDNVNLKDKVASVFELVGKTGIDYISLGQSLNTLSTGELQAIKLVSELSSLKQKALILLDEPTGGLHPNDKIRMLNLFKELLNSGHTIICATHDQMLIEFASRIIDLDKI